MEDAPQTDDVTLALEDLRAALTTVQDLEFSGPDEEPMHLSRGYVINAFAHLERELDHRRRPARASDVLAMTPMTPFPEAVRGVPVEVLVPLQVFVHYARHTDECSDEMANHRPCVCGLEQVLAVLGRSPNETRAEAASDPALAAARDRIEAWTPVVQAAGMWRRQQTATMESGLIRAIDEANIKGWET